MITDLIKMRDAADPSPPNKMLWRSDSLENKYSDSTGHSKAKNVHVHRVRERDGGTGYSPQEIHTTPVLFIVQIHILLIQEKLQRHLMILQMTGLSILAPLGKNTTTVVKQKFHNGKNQEWLAREERRKETSKMAVNSFPKERLQKRGDASNSH